MLRGIAGPSKYVAGIGAIALFSLFLTGCEEKELWFEKAASRVALKNARMASMLMIPSIYSHAKGDCTASLNQYLAQLGDYPDLSIRIFDNDAIVKVSDAKGEVGREMADLVFKVDSDREGGPKFSCYVDSLDGKSECFECHTRNAEPIARIEVCAQAMPTKDFMNLGK